MKFLFLCRVEADCTFLQTINSVHDDNFIGLPTVYHYFDRIGTECFGFSKETTVLGDIARWFDVVYGRGYYR